MDHFALISLVLIKKLERGGCMLFLVNNLALTVHHCADEFFIVDIAMRVLLIHQKLLNLKKVNFLIVLAWIGSYLDKNLYRNEGDTSTYTWKQRFVLVDYLKNGKVSGLLIDLGLSI